MIKIVKGTYGLVDKKGFVRPMRESNGPFSTRPEEEARLVGLGVAVYVDDEPAQVEPVQAEPAKDEDGDQADKLLEEMTANNLRELAKERYGLTLKIGMKKSDMIQAIKDVQAELAGVDEDEDGDGDDAPPEFDPTEAVE